ncbi:MAG: hypothetical protein E7633_10205 [Ruminococcaceae bacterium]|nr:hypothetical protein [Oscillospiraceae bacterium]
MPDYKESFDEFKKLNKEIFTYRHKRRIKLFIKIAIFEIPIILLLVSGLALDPVKSVTLFSVLAIVLPILIFEPYKLYRKPCIGEIVGFKYTERYVFPKGVVIRGHAVRIETFVTFFVKGFDGKKHSFTLLRKYEIIYRKGDTVMLVPGIDYPVCYTKRRHVLCMKCGALYIPHNQSEYCEAKFCDMPLPKIPEKDPDYLKYFDIT